MTSPAQEILKAKLLQKLENGEITLDQLMSVDGATVAAASTDTAGEGDVGGLISEIVSAIFEEEGAENLTEEDLDELISEVFHQVAAV